MITVHQFIPEKNVRWFELFIDKTDEYTKISLRYSYTDEECYSIKQIIVA